MLQSVALKRTRRHGSGLQKHVVKLLSAARFNVKERRVPFKSAARSSGVTLKHVGEDAARHAMGRNIVDHCAAAMQAAITDGMAAGAGADYVKTGDARVLRLTPKVIGWRQDYQSSTSMRAKLKAGTDYAFFCFLPRSLGPRGRARSSWAPEFPKLPIQELAALSHISFEVI